MADAFWYIVVLVEGHDYLLPGGETEQQAREKACRVLHGESYEIRAYKTRDLTEATRQYKHERLMKTKDIRQAVEPVKHVIPTTNRFPPSRLDI